MAMSGAFWISARMLSYKESKGWLFWVGWGQEAWAAACHANLGAISPSKATLAWPFYRWIRLFLLAGGVACFRYEPNFAADIHVLGVCSVRTEYCTSRALYQVYCRFASTRACFKLAHAKHVIPTRWRQMPSACGKNMLLTVGDKKVMYCLYYSPRTAPFYRPISDFTSLTLLSSMFWFWSVAVSRVAQPARCYRTTRRFTCKI